VSGNDSIAQLHIENLNQAAIGNDFAIDDIAFSTVRSCTNAATVQIQTAQQDLGLEYPPNICVNQAPINPILSPNTSPNGTYNATPGGLNIDPISGIINGLGSTPGIYNIVYSTSQCNSLASDTFQVMVNALPALLSLTGGAYNCQTETFDSVLLYLNAPLPANVNWTLNGTPQSTIMNSNPLYLGSEPGSYQLGMVTDLYCSNNLSGSILLDTLDIPQTPVIIGDTLICENEPPGVISLINANPNGVISWFSDPNLTQFIESGNMFYPDTDSSASYFVVQTVNGCISDMLSFSIQVVPCNLVIPSAFTPDGDGDNDHWEIIGLDGKYPLNQVSVYNRWGELIYLSQEGDYAASPWDGTYQGIDLPVGSYYYIIEKASDGSVEPVNGTITILRTP
jgi:gliding motility-associated-like protein